MKKILILAGSPHPEGNSSSLAAALAEGVRQGGGTVEIIQLARQKINFCLGCDYCRSHGGECIQQDDMAAILTRVEAADAIVLATPLYFLNFSAQLKVCIDRFYSRHHAGTLAGKAGALLVTSGGANRAGVEIFFAAYQALMKLLHWADKGIVWVGGYRHDGTIRASTAMDEARSLGMSLAGD